MRRYFMWIVAAVIPVMCVAEPSIKIDGVAAYVNAHVITISDVIKTSRDLQQELSGPVKDVEKLNQAYMAALQDVIDRKLIVDDYDNQKKIKIPESIFIERADATIDSMFNGSRSDFLDALEADQLSEEVWRANMREKVIVSVMENFRVDDSITISPLAARELYESERENYTTQPSVKLRMIVIEKGDSPEEQAAQKSKLDKLLAELKEGGDFAELAKQYSEDSYAAEGADRGWMKRDMLRKDLAEVAFDAKIGEVCDVVDIGSVYCLMKVEDKVAAQEISFEEARPIIEKQLRAEQTTKLRDEWLKRLRKNGYIKIVDETPF